MIVTLNGGLTLAENNTVPASLTVTRSSLSGSPNLTQNSLTVTLGFGGTASYGVDYVITGVSPSGTVTIPSGSTSVTLQVTPVLDTRFEGEESLFVYAITPSNNAYTSDGTFADFTILDDDSNQVPLAGWKLTDLSTPNSLVNMATDINERDLVLGTPAVWPSQSTPTG